MNALRNDNGSKSRETEDFQTFGLPTVSTEREYAKRIFGSPEEFVNQLGLTPRESAVFISEVSRSGIHRGLLKPYICAEYAGIPLYRPFESFNLTAISHHSTRNVITLIEQYDFIRSVRAEAKPFKGFPEFTPFSCTIREVAGPFLPHITGHNGNSISLLLQLPQNEWETLIRNSSPGGAKYFNALAEVRVSHLKDNKLEVLEISSRFNSITSAELRERYQNWPHIIMRALIDYAAHQRPLHSPKAREDDKRNVENPNEIEIIFASPNQMRQVFREKEDCGAIMGSFPVYDNNLPDKTKYTLPALSVELATLFYRELPLHYGFTKASFDIKVGERNEEKHDNSLSLKVPFIRGKSDQDPLFCLEKPSARLKHWIKLQQDTFDGIDFSVLEHQPYPVSHPIRPQTPTYLKKAAEVLHTGAELAESLRFPELRMPCNTRSREAKLEELRGTIPGRQIFEELIPAGFAPVSKGLGYGPTNEWWKIPGCQDGEIAAQFVHLKEQNRHPSLRLSVPGLDGAPNLLGSYSFKGAGVASIDDVRVIKPFGRRLPIYHRQDDIVEIDGKKVYKSQYGGHELWGGQKRSGAIKEYFCAGELALFLGAVEPKLTSASAIPISVERYLAFPSWKKDGQVEWHDPFQYYRLFLSELSAGNGLFQAVTYSKSDVRLGQLVAKVFAMGANRPASITETETGIIDALRYLYHTHGLPFSQGQAELLPSGAFGIRDIGKFLKAVAHENRAAAEKIYSDFEERLIGALGAVHGGDGNFGGLRRHGGGLMFGGPQTIRNIDLFGTMHDYETNPYLPWAPIVGNSEAEIISEESERTFLQGADALLCKESLYWMRKVLFGFESSLEVTTKKHKIDSKQDITVLTSKDNESRALSRSFKILMTGGGAEEVLKDERTIEKYRGFAARGREVAEELTERPW